MRTIKRILLGALSSLFLSIGLVRAAQQIDPMIPTHSVDAGISGTAADTVTECWIDDSQS